MKGLFLLLCLPLGAQTAVMRTHMDREAKESAAPATLLVLDAKGSRALAEGFTALLQQEELRAFQVPVKTYALGSGAEKDLLAHHRLEAKAQWLLVDRRDAVLSRGLALPDAARLAKDLQAAGFQDLVKELRAYVKDYPASIDGREALIAHLRQRAELTAQRHMGLQVERGRDLLERGDLEGYQRAQQDPAAADLGAARPLTELQDLDAWGAFAQELDAAFRSGQWREMDFEWTREGRALDAASPTLRVVYQRWQPTVEAALQRQPESEAFWSLWLWMNAATGSARLRPLLASLQPSPLTPKDQWPPDSVAHALLRSARRPEEWRSLKELYLARWTEVPHPLRETPPAGRDASSTGLDEDWRTTLEPLLECCLRGGDTSQADSLFLEALGTSQWKALPSRGAALAKRCAQPSLAARWAALRIP